MSESRAIEYAATQGAEFGFEKGFESAIAYLRSIGDVLPDETTKTLVAKLAEGLERFSADAKIQFVDGFRVSAIKTNNSNSPTIH